jgi:hypothetical protein
LTRPGGLPTLPTRFGPGWSAGTKLRHPLVGGVCLVGPEQVLRDFARSLKTECRAVCGEPESSSRR